MLAAALELFERDGYGNVAMSRIAQEAGVAAGTIYTYFRSKDELANALYRQCKVALAGDLLEGTADDSGSRAAFGRFWRTLITFATRQPTALAFLETHRHDVYLDEESRALGATIDARAAEFVERGQRSGRSGQAHHRRSSPWCSERSSACSGPATRVASRWTRRCWRNWRAPRGGCSHRRPSPMTTYPPREQSGAGVMKIEVNGEQREIDADGVESAVELIRDGLGLTGTKLVCGGGVCGACTVHVDGRPVASCLLPAERAGRACADHRRGAGHAPGPPAHPVQRALMAHDGLQCGFCTPGFVMAASAFHDRWRAAHAEQRPSREQVAAGLAGHLCRCGAYEGITAAVQAACAGEFDEPGGASPRVEAAAKVTGAARYTVDVTVPGMLHGVIVRSERAHARVLRVDLAPALAGPGTVAVDLLGDERTVRYQGQPIAAVAAGSEAAARAAARSVVIDYADLPAALDADAAAAGQAPTIYQDKAQRRAAPSSAEGGPPLPTRWLGNLRGPITVSLRGRRAVRLLDAAAERGDSGYVAATFRTAAQVHTALEPHATLADWRADGSLTLHASTQAVEHLRAAVAARWELDPERVQVVAEHVGGGFGAKTAMTTDTVAAVELSRAAGARCGWC